MALRPGACWLRWRERQALEQAPLGPLALRPGACWLRWRERQALEQAPLGPLALRPGACRLRWLEARPAAQADRACLGPGLRWPADWAVGSRRCLRRGPFRKTTDRYPGRPRPFGLHR